MLHCVAPGSFVPNYLPFCASHSDDCFCSGNAGEVTERKQEEDRSYGQKCELRRWSASSVITFVISWGIGCGSFANDSAHALASRQNMVYIPEAITLLLFPTLMPSN